MAETSVEPMEEEIKEEVMEEESESGEEEEEEEEDAPSPFLGWENFDAYSNTLLPAVVEILKVSRQLPTTKDEYDFYQSYPSFMSFSKNQGQRLLQVIGKIFKHHHVYQAWSTVPSTSVTGVDEQSEAVVEANDTLLERVDKILDMLRPSDEQTINVQHKDDKKVMVAAWNSTTSSPASTNKPVRLLHCKNILRPQLRWKVKPNNTHDPFIPFIKNKPNAMVGLQQEFIDLIQTDNDEITDFLKSARRSVGKRGKTGITYPHPYEYELDHFEPQAWQFEVGTKRAPLEITDTPLTVYDKVEQLPDLYKKLEAATEIAVDLEAHSYRSFLGFTCLMQISTRTEDFIVDTLSLRGDLQGLNHYFTDPHKVKILHGSHNDVQWLQRDLGLYMVNLFDTYHASKQLGLPRCSLSYLLQRYCNVIADKQYQLADWRIRPLPEVMIKYAREDTHYLLFVYDCLRYDLFQKGLHALESVYRNSVVEARQVYKKPQFTEDSYLDVYDKVRISLKPQQKECLHLLYGWRDQTARSEDESTAFVLPNHMLYKIAEILPIDQEGILACCNPPPPIVRLHVQEIHLIVEKARHYNPLLDPKRSESKGEEYTPEFLDTKHEKAVESLFEPKLTPTTRIKQRKQIFYIPKTGPNVQIQNSSILDDKSDCISIKSDSGSVSIAPTTQEFFNSDNVQTEFSEAVRSVKEAMAAPFRHFMQKIEQLKQEELEKELADKEAAEAAAVEKKNVTTEVKEEEGEEEKEDTSVIEFQAKGKRSREEEKNELKATSKKKKAAVVAEPFDYQTQTVKKIGRSEEKKPDEEGDNLAGVEKKKKQTKQRNNMKSGNKSGFQAFMKNKFKNPGKKG